MIGSIKKISTCHVALMLAWFLWVFLCAPWNVAHATTAVTTDITSNTTWRLANAPYVVSGDIAISGNAMLVIEPGVRVLFQENASLRVERGTLSAQGTSVQPIVFTSIHDDAQGIPAAGDWGALKFLRGTHDISTILSHVQVRYGEGIVVEGSSPTFNNVRIENNAGPAIMQDLASSPRGQGLEASGNLLNGILVPAGEINTDIVWALRGIPYVLEQGTIHIGKSTFALFPSQLQLVNGVTATLEVTVPDAAPAGGLMIDVVSSVPSVASVLSAAIVNEGERSAQVEIQANALGTTTISASAAGFGTVTATIHVIESPLLSLTPGQAVISIENGGAMSVSLPDVAPANGCEILLASNPAGIISVPASVNIPAGASTAVFDAAGISLGSTVLTASTEGYSSASATIQVRPISLNLPDSVLVAPGLARSMSILLTDPAPAGGLSILLESDNTGVANVPASVQVPAGVDSIEVDIQGVAVGTAQIEASAPGYESDTVQVRVENVTIQLQPAGVINIPKGVEIQRSVRISSPAPEGGVWVMAQALDTTIASVTPASVFIPSGQTAATTMLTLKGETEGSTQLQLSSAGLVQTQVLMNIGQPARLEFSRVTSVVGKGLNTYINELHVKLRSGGASYIAETPVVISLNSADVGKATVPATITVPAGQSQIRFVVSGADLTSEPVAISAMAQGYISPQVPLMVTVVTPELQFMNLDDTRGVGGANDDFYVRWYVPGALYPTDQTATSDQAFMLSIEDASPDGLVSGFRDYHGNPVNQITISSGRSNSIGSGFASRYIYVATPTMAGTYKVAATLPGVGSWMSATQTIVGAQLEFSRSAVVMGLGLSTSLDDVRIQLKANGQNAPTAAPLVIELSSADPGKVGVPATVTIPAGQYLVRFRVSGLALTNEPVAITASAAGHSPSQIPLMATVVTPQLRFMGLDGTRGVGSAHDEFYVSWHVPGAVHENQQVATFNQAIALSIEDASPAGVVSGFVDNQGNTTAQIVIAAGHNSNSQRASVSTPTMPGTYKVGATLPGTGFWTSETQTVVGAQLEFSKTAVVAGHGLDTHQEEVYIQLKVNGQNAPTATPLVVELFSADPGKVAVPTTVTIPAGRHQVGFRISGLDLTNEPVAITASAAGYTSTQTPMMASVVTPQLRFTSLDGTRGIGGINDEFHVSWYVPDSNYPYSHTATANQLIALSIEDMSPAGVVPGFVDSQGNTITQVVIASGNSSNQQRIYVSTPVMPGTYKVGASLSGIGSWMSGVQDVFVPQLRFSRNSVVVGRGMNSYSHEVYLRQTVNDTVFYAAAPVTVSLACAAASVCTTPATVTIPVGQPQIDLVITGTGLGATKVIPNATNYVAAQELDVTTVVPQVVLPSIPSSLTVGSTINFPVSLHVPGANYSNYQTAAAPILIDLTSAQPSVATVPAQITISTGASSQSAPLAATGAGTTTVTASGLNVLPATSDMITVQQP